MYICTIRALVLYPEISIIREMFSSILGEHSVTFVFPSAFYKRFCWSFCERQIFNISFRNI